MRSLNQCTQCAHGVSESVVPVAGHAGDVVVFGGVERRRGGVCQGKSGLTSRVSRLAGGVKTPSLTTTLWTKDSYVLRPVSQVGSTPLLGRDAIYSSCQVSHKPSISRFIPASVTSRPIYWLTRDHPKFISFCLNTRHPRHLGDLGTSIKKSFFFAPCRDVYDLTLTTRLGGYTRKDLSSSCQTVITRSPNFAFRAIL